MFSLTIDFNPGADFMLNWDTSNVKNMAAMFNRQTNIGADYYEVSFFNPPAGFLRNFDTSKVTDMSEM